MTTSTATPRASEFGVEGGIAVRIGAEQGIVRAAHADGAVLAHACGAQGVPVFVDMKSGSGVDAEAIREHRLLLFQQHEDGDK